MKKTRLYDFTNVVGWLNRYGTRTELTAAAKNNCAIYGAYRNNVCSWVVHINPEKSGPITPLLADQHTYVKIYFLEYCTGTDTYQYGTLPVHICKGRPQSWYKKETQILKT
jgi:hypothetical protein